VPLDPTAAPSPSEAVRRLRSAAPDVVRAGTVVALLYLFLVGVAMLESGIAGLGEGFQDSLLREIAHPIAGLCTGIVLTVLVQSSSVSTATIVGLVGAGTLSVPLAVPMIMGANIGTTVTNTLASLGAIRRPEEFRRGLAAATMHDFFNVLAVAVLLPIELSTRWLSRTAIRATDVLSGREVGAAPAPSPIRAAVKAPVSLANDLLAGSGVSGVAVGIVRIVIALALILLALTYITRLMRALVAGSVERAMNRVVGSGGGLAGILIGIAVTVAVQSSSITTSILVPLVSAGILSVRNAFPITLGANVGTTVTALIASLAVARPEGLTIALVHTLFNVVAIVLIYPVRRIRDVPVRLAQSLADAAVRRRSAVFAYIIALFIVLPLIGIFLFD
jgi:solute carrier family 34 (sodium-dependent phosphate cotransporter)